MMNIRDDTIRYSAPPDTATSPWSLVLVGGREEGRIFPFSERIGIGRLKGEEGNEQVGRILIRDATISSNHCSVTTDKGGRVFVQDISRNGTRLDGRRLSPNIRTEMKIGQTITVGVGHQLRLDGVASEGEETDPGVDGQTQGVDDVSIVTVLVGDICSYTGLVQDVEPAQLRKSASRVFTRLERAVMDLGGSVGGFQGDSILAFWEKASSKDFAIQACDAALKLQQLVSELAADQTVWNVEGLPLEMDWAIATGLVAIQAHGDTHAVGLAMVGEPVVLAFRIEKLASPEMGRIIACQRTMKATESRFSYEEIGEHQVKGFDKDWELFSLVGRRQPRPRQ